MPQPVDAYRKGYEQGRRDNLGGNVSEAVFGLLRDDPRGYFAAGYRDGAGGKEFNPPIETPAYQRREQHPWTLKLVIAGFFGFVFLPVNILIALSRKRQSRLQIGWQLVLLGIWLAIAISGMYQLQQASGRRMGTIHAPEAHGKNQNLPDVSEGAPTRTFARASSVLKPQFGAHYDADNVLDGRLDTAWVEGVAGQGLGEWIEIEFPTNTLVSEIEIFPGYGKSERLFTRNSRPKRIQIQFVGEYAHSGNPRTEEIALEDEMKWQIFKVTPPVATFDIRFTIMDVYPGTAHEDTAISEIRVR
jgi:hypothetical protein